MKTVFKILILFCLYGSILSCAGKPIDDDDSTMIEDTDSESAADAESETGTEDDVADESEEGSGETANSEEDVDQDLEKEQKVAEGGDPLLDEDPLSEEVKKDQAAEDPQALAQKSEEQSTDPQATPPQSVEPPPAVVAEENKDPLLDTPPDAAPVISSPPSEVSQSTPAPDLPSTNRSEITNIRFESNEAGGSIIVEGNQALDFSGRFNPQSHQYVVEVRNAHLPDHLKRPYITKDFQSPVGAIDAYQTPGSDTVKIVVQLREGASEPNTHTEGSTIVIVPSGGLVSQSQNLANSSDPSSSSSSTDVFSNDGVSPGLLSSNNLGQFLSGNMKYYGKKISIEMRDIEVRNAINLIAEESGANLVMSEGVTGNIALKLKNVPWDQALVLILKAKKLGYTRQGNVLRISPMIEIKQEEEDAMKLAESRRKIEPLKVQMIPINYSKISDLQAQIKTVLSDRGSIVADARTNALIITETDEVLERAKKIISSLDIAPAQVLIEGKLVEARESFNKKLGINWDVAGQSQSVGTANMTPNLSIRPPGVSSGASLGFNLSLGTLDLLGDLNAILSLEEEEENVKVISSPRIVTLHNEEASITQAATVSVLASEVTSLGGASTQTTNRTYKDLSLKMELKVTPEIANNGIVQLKVDIVRDFVGAVKDDGSASPQSRSAKTKVMVKSGQTAVIGGIYQNDASQAETGVPFLRDIPILGYLFRGRTYQKNKTELLLFLTPRVLSQAGSGGLNENNATMSSSQSENNDSSLQ